MRRSSTSSLMALAQGRACSNVVRAKEDPPSRWHETQRLSTRREISRDQVILVENTSWALSMPPPPTRRETIEYLMLLASASVGFIGFVQGREEILQAHVGWYHDVIEAEHHFFPALLAETNGGRRIGIVRIVGRVVEPTGAFDDGSGRDLQRLSQLIVELPEKVVVWNSEQHFGSPVGINGAIFERLSAHVHVRKEIQDGGFIREFGLGRHRIVGIARRNLESQIVPGKRKGAFGGLFLGEDQAYLGMVHSLFAIGGVVDLQHQVRTGGNHLAESGPPHLGNFSRRVDHQDIAATAGCIGKVLAR